MVTSAVSVDELRRALEASWDRETSSDPEGWEPDNPALGQCAVTALVVQDFLGGELLRAVVGHVSHYWNNLSDDTELDLTRHQFKQYQPKGRERRERAYVLSFPETMRRYVRLSGLVAAQLEKQSARA